MRLALQICCLILLTVPASNRAVDYVKDIKPLLQERCYSCHGALKQKHDLRVDTVAAMLKGGSDGPVIVLGSPEKSSIVQRVSTADIDERMPPEHEGQPFTSAQVELLKEWISAGAPAPENEKADADPRDHWAFREIKRPATPAIKSNSWARNPIDAFIAKGHEKHGLATQTEAPRAIQMRRLYLDLIGLPPSIEEISTAFKAPAETWYDDTVKKLLNDPRHGERWARHWMDIWRYSDPYGLGDQYRNSDRNIWHFRDWIIESLNADLPYDEMIRLMLAADELHPTDLDKLRATGFLVRNLYIFNRNQWMEETVEHVSKGLLGLTMNCAKCHDHKYDPIRQVEFYQMRAFFEPYHVRQELLKGELDVMKDGIPRVFDAVLDAPTYRFVRGQENQPDKASPLSAAVPRFLAFKNLEVRTLALPAEAREPERRAGIAEGYMEAAVKKRKAGAAEVPKARQAMIKALRSEADFLEALESNNTNSIKLTREQARLAVDEARAALNVAEATHALARAEVIGIKRRMEAMQAAWKISDGQSNEPKDADYARERNGFAVLQERQVSLAKARLTLAEAEQRLVKAADDKRESISKEIKDAREAIVKTKQLAEAELKPEDKFTMLAGAKWTPTRFLSSTADDPAVKFPAQSTGRRKALADWITDTRNPLTARVAVNHIWARHFGTPLAQTTFDLGRKGVVPVNRELIDWLAAELIESGWSMKHLHRLIVSSSAYRMSSSSAGVEMNAEKDPDNLYLWRRNSIRLEGEAIRDSMLSLAGTLDQTMGGPPVPTDKQDESKRRSLYFFHSNNERNLLLTTFDGANVRECYRREQSIVPQQALALSNGKLALDASDLIARRFSDTDDESFIKQAMLNLLAIDPSSKEIAACREALEDWRKSDAAPSARAHLIWSLLNHNDFVTLR
jgi:hypothetical protein